MGLSEETLAVAKKYTNESISGISGTLAGKNCTIKSITAITGGNRITFEWTADDNTTRTSTMDVMNGEDGKGISSIAVNSSNHLIITYSDGTTSDAGLVEITAAVDSVNGKKGNVTITATDVNAYTKTEVDTALGNKADKATTLSGYGITDAYTKTETDTLLDGKADSATTLSGYGITDAYTKTEVDTALADKADSATTLSGYGITDAYTKTETDTLLSAKADSTTTLSGYGITDAYTSTETDSAITAAIEALDVTDSAVAGSYVTEVSETDGAISVTREAADNTPTSSSTKMITSGGVYTDTQNIYKANGVLGAKNIFNTANQYAGTVNNIKSINSDGSVIRVANETANTWRNAIFILNVVPNTDYKVTGYAVYTSGHCGLDIRTTGDVTIKGTEVITEDTDISYVFNSGNNTQLWLVMVLTRSTSEIGDITFNNVMVRLASDTDSTYQPYCETNYQLTQNKVDWDDYAQTGAVNMLPITATTQVISGITWTVNDDGTVTAGAGTAGSSGSQLQLTGALKLETGKRYRVTGCPIGGATSGAYYLAIYQSGVIDKSDIGDGYEFIATAAMTDVKLYAIISGNITITAKTFKPMLSLASANLSYDDYVPYAKTNHQLTEDSVTWDDYAVNGAVNMIYPIDPTNTDSAGVTWTLNSDNSISVSSGGVAPSTGTGFSYRNNNAAFLRGKTVTFKANVTGNTPTYDKLYFAVICRETESGANLVRYDVWPITGQTEVTFTVPNNTNYILIGCNIQNGATTAIDCKISPIVYLASYNGDYVPYAKTNKELTSDISDLNSRIETVNNFYVTGDTIEATALALYGVSNAAGTEISFMYPLPKKVLGAVNVSSHSETIDWIRGNGTSITSGLTITSVSLQRPSFLQISISGSFSPLTVYIVALSSVTVTV